MKLKRYSLKLHVMDNWNRSNSNRPEFQQCVHSYLQLYPIRSNPSLPEGPLVSLHRLSSVVKRTISNDELGRLYMR